MQVARLALAMVLGIALPFLAQWLDRRRLAPPVRARSWNVATWGAALYGFGPLSMLGWFWTTRPRWRRVWSGGLATGGMVGVLQLVDVVLTFALGEPVEPTEIPVALAAATAGGIVLLGAMELVVAVRRRLH
ncbi:MAG: transcriptional regulator [Deltaproteobacteria bacterium]|nr:transcriptional regulator [Deltaproteobacteria bacterium]